MPVAEYTLRGDCWPTEAQTWLLRAALLAGRPAREAWEIWRAHDGQLAGLDPGSRRLLPLLYDNLRVEQIADPLMAELKAEFRKTWHRNQALFHRISALLSALAAEGISTLILKGAALAVVYYKNPGLRPMADFDILVHSVDAPRTLDALARAGWRCVLEANDPRRLLGVRNSIGFIAEDGGQFDLHWHMLLDHLQPEADAAFWATSVPAQIHAVPTLALDPTHQLLHVCVHGAAYDAVPPLRWAADAMQILRRSPAAVDWQQLVRQAAALRLGQPLHDTLYFLQARLDAPVPGGTLASLRALPSSPIERRLYQGRLNRPGIWGALPVLWQHYTYLAQADGRPANFLGFVRYLQYSWGLAKARQLPPLMLQKAVRRLRAVGARAVT